MIDELFIENDPDRPSIWCTDTGPQIAITGKSLGNHARIKIKPRRYYDMPASILLDSEDAQLVYRWLGKFLNQSNQISCPQCEYLLFPADDPSAHFCPFCGYDLNQRRDEPDGGSAG